MRKIICLIVLSFLIIFSVSCDNKTVSQNEKITINQPTDDTVNGYKSDTNKSNGNTISGKEFIENNGRVPSQNKENGNLNQDNYSGQYCANVNTKVFHYPTCSSAEKMKEENKIFFSDRQELIDSGYTPCKRCNP